MIDGYAHLGMPRFWQVSDYLPVMEELGITRALVCPFDSCPDLAECHLAISRHPDRFRAFGLALGHAALRIPRQRFQLRAALGERWLHVPCVIAHAPRRAKPASILAAKACGAS